MKKEIQNGPDVLALVVKIQEQLAALDRKVDVLIGRSSAGARSAAPVPQPAKPAAAVPAPAASVQPDQHRGKAMHPATCAECKKECLLPFKPNGDRPVYCKECFAQRKTGGVGKPHEVPRSREEAPVSASSPVVLASAPVREIKKPTAVVVKKPVVAVKKPAVKRPAPKKKTEK